jgi:hypothetical protein
MKLHMAKEGDTIHTLSEKYEIELERILAANPHIEDSESLTRGTKVKIPSGPVSMQQAKEQATQEEKVLLAGLQPTSAGVKPESLYNEGAMGADTAAVSSVPNLANPFANTANPTHTWGIPGSLEAQAATPAFYKTELPASNQSPLHVKWSGMQDGAAVHPYAPLPTPTVPAGAGAPAFYPGPFGFGTPSLSPAAMVPYGGYGGHYQAPESVFAPSYGVFPDPFAAAQGVFAPAAGDCGCGGGPRLPYALPLRSTTDAPAEFARANVTGVAAETPVESAPKASGPEEKIQSAKRKTKPPTRTDSLQALLRRSKARRKPTRRASKPWVND